MIDKRLIGMMGDSKRYIAKNVALQWLALAANVAMIFAVSRYLGALYDQLTIGDTMAGAPNLPLTLGIVAAALLVRAACTRGAAAASYNASRTVKKTLRSAIYEKLLRLGGSYTQAVPTAEVLQLAGEGVEQLETYFGAYLPQFFYAMLAPVTLFVVLAPVSVKAAVILMICVPLIPVSIVAVQKFAKRLLGKYWGQYAALGDSFLENLQGLTTLKIYQADETRHQAMNREAEHFRKVTMKVLTHAAELHHRDGHHRLRRCGAGHRYRCAGAGGRSCQPERRALHPAAVGGFLPAHARAGVLLPCGHERHGRQR